MFGVDPSQPSGPTTKLNVDVVVEFGEFGCGDQNAGKMSASLEHRRLVWTTGVSVVVSGILLIMSADYDYDYDHLWRSSLGQVRGVSERKHSLFYRIWQTILINLFLAHKIK